MTAGDELIERVTGFLAHAEGEGDIHCAVPCVMLRALLARLETVERTRAEWLQEHADELLRYRVGDNRIANRYAAKMDDVLRRVRERADYLAEHGVMSGLASAVPEAFDTDDSKQGGSE